MEWSELVLGVWVHLKEVRGCSMVSFPDGGLRGHFLLPWVSQHFRVYKSKGSVSISAVGYLRGEGRGKI
jgi:hypothetical protein